MKYINIHSIIAALSLSLFSSCRQPQDASMESAFANPPAEQRVGWL